MPVKCKYCNHGCDFEQLPSKKEALNDHEKECQHRNISCIMATCTEIVSLSKLSLHLKNHKNSTNDVTGAQLKDRPMKISKYNFGLYQWISWKSTHFTLKRSEKEFYSVWARGPDGFFFLWVYIIGTPEEEKNFTYTITLTNTDKVIISFYLLSTVTDTYLYLISFRLRVDHAKVQSFQLILHQDKFVH